jgi:hypothetical protein
MMEASASSVPNPGLVGSYSRIRDDLLDAVEEKHGEEIERLFPAELASDGRPWGVQSAEVQTRFSQMAGWLGGIIEEARPDPQMRPRQ